MSKPPLDAWRPPDGYVPLDSQVEGVELFGPAPSDEDRGPAERTRCPSCGATLRWDPGHQALVCGYCDTRVAAQQGDEAGPGEFTAEAMQRGERGWGAERPELRCDGCGAVLTIAREQLTSTCPLCASERVHVHEAKGDALRPGHVLPFAIRHDQAHETARKWLGSGWLRPAGVRDAALEQFTGVYLPFWVFRSDLHTDYRVQVGTKRTVTERNSDGSTTTRTTIDWRWESGHLDLHDVLVSVPATDRVPGVENVKPFPFDQLLPYTPDVLVGFVAHGYSIPLPEGWEEGRDRLRQYAQGAACAQHPGDQYRSFSGTVDLDDESWRYALLPVWVSAYTWGGKSWVVLVNGATGTIEGTRPVAWGRVWLAIAAMLTPGLFSGGCLGLPLLAFAGLGMFFLILGFILLIFGIIGSGIVYAKAVDEETL